MARSVFTVILCAAALGVPALPASAKGLASLYSCSAEGNTNTKAAVVGGLVGALAGSQISKDNRAIGAALGAGLGAVIGNGIGCRMDRKTQLDAQQAFQRALDTGTAQNWSDPQTGTSGRIQVLNRYGSPQSGTVSSARWRFADGVTPASRVSNVGGTYAARSRVNVRAAPNTSSPVVDRLQVGEQFQSTGSANGGWLAIVEGGLVQGYVAGSTTQKVGGGLDGDCRRVEQTINERGQPTIREQFDACRDANGSWNLNAI